MNDAPVETDRIMESLINGSHYNCSLSGFLIIEDTPDSMKWKIFWAMSGKSVEPKNGHTKHSQLDLYKKIRRLFLRNYYLSCYIN